MLLPCLRVRVCVYRVVGLASLRAQGAAACERVGLGVHRDEDLLHIGAVEFGACSAVLCSACMCALCVFCVLCAGGVGWGGVGWGGVGWGKVWCNEVGWFSPATTTADSDGCRVKGLLWVGVHVA